MEGMDHPRRVEVRIGVVAAGAESGAAAGGDGGGTARGVGNDAGSTGDGGPGGSPGARAGEWVEVRIADRGVGLPEGVGDRIFEPDFTTKSRGTGLGLALVRQAVAAHGGVVCAEARPGGGTEFVVRLPATTERVAITV
jgi:signal transduction histidine kinase